jgi:hypothetical protein
VSTSIFEVPYLTNTDTVFLEYAFVLRLRLINEKRNTSSSTNTTANIIITSRVAIVVPLEFFPCSTLATSIILFPLRISASGTEAGAGAGAEVGLGAGAGASDAV